MSKYTENEPQRKEVPFSIKEISDIKKWREDQVIEYAEFKRRRQARFDAAKSLPQGELSDWHKNPSESGKKIALAWKKMSDQPIPILRTDVFKRKKESYLKRLTNKAIDWFLAIKF